MECIRCGTPVIDVCDYCDAEYNQRISSTYANPLLVKGQREQNERRSQIMKKLNEGGINGFEKA